MLEWKFRLVALLAVAGVIAAASGELFGALSHINFGW
jgi:hypothetical protein